MKSIRILTFVAVLVVSATPSLSAAAVDPAAAVTLEGTVVGLASGARFAMPTLVIDDAEHGETAIRLGPAWYLKDQGFSAAAGDRARAVAFPCLVCAADWVAAEVENLTTGVAVALRDGEGSPVWHRGTGGPGPRGPYGPWGRQRHRRGDGPGPERHGDGPHGSGQGAGPQGAGCPGGPDLSAVATVTGSVLAFEGGAGERMPTLTLIAGDDRLEIFVGPSRLWLDAGFEVTVGQELEVTYAPAGLEDHLVAFSVTDPAAGLTLTLRDPETGRPTGGGGQGCCRDG